MDTVNLPTKRLAELRRRTMQLLVAPRVDLPRLAAAVGAMGAWEEVIRLCERWRVVPTLAAQLKASAVVLPPEEADRIRQVTAQEFVRTTLRMRGGAAALAVLDATGIEGAAFKGMAVLTWLHGSKPRRSIQDVDLLVRPDDISKAVAALRAHGFQPKLGDVPFQDYLAFVRDSPGAAGNEAISLVGPDGTDIDLHWKLGALNTQRLLSAARCVPLFGATVRVLDPADGLRLTAHHALRNDLVPDDIARDVLDAQGWFRLHGGAEVGEDASALGDVIGALRLILAQLGAGEDPRYPPASAAAWRLAALYDRQLTEGAINTDLPYVLSLHSVRQVLRGAWRDRRRYLAMMHAFETANGERVLSPRGRLARLAYAVWHTAPSQWGQLRTLARAKNQLI
jgi:hypothetical protein